MYIKNKTLQFFAGNPFLVALTFALGMCLFAPTLALASQTVGLSASGRFTLPYRIVQLAVACLLVVTIVHRGRWRINGYIVAGLAFWAMYIVRVVVEGQRDGVIDNRTWVAFLGFCLVAVLSPAFSAGFRYTQKEGETAFKTLFFFLGLSGVVLLIVFREQIGVGYRMATYQGFAEDAVISPLAFSYTGAHLICLSIYQIWRRDKMTTLIWIWVAVSFFMGAALLTVGEARNALVSIAAVLVLLLTVTPKGGETKREGSRWAVVLGSVVFAATLYASMAFMQTGLPERINKLVEESWARDENAGSGRLGIWTRGLAQFRESPWLGCGIKEEVVQYSAHNLYLESFMATGVMGGTIVLVLTFAGVVKARRLLRERPGLGWLSVLLVEKAASGFVSTSVVEFEFWVPLFAVFANDILRGADVAPALRADSSYPRGSRIIK